MMQTISLNNHGDARHGLRLMLFDLRRHIGLGSIFAALMFLAMPFAIAMGIQAINFNSRMFHDTKNYLSNPDTIMPLVYFSYALLVILSILAVVIIPAILFKYMDNKRSVDLYHSIPVSRTSLFFSHYCSGLLLILIPTLFAFLCTILVRFLFNASGIDLGWLFKSVFTLLLMQTASYTFSVFVAVNTGTVFDMILSLLVLNGIWPALYFTYQLFGICFLHGFAFRPTMEAALLFSPIPRLVASFAPSLFGCLWWGGLTILMLAGALTLYRRRKSECAGLPFAYSLLGAVIRYGLSFLAGALFGLFLWAITSQLFFLFVGFFIGMALCFIIVVAITNRGFKHFLSLLKGIPVLIGVFVIVFVVFLTGGLGYETRVPQAASVESVEFELNGAVSSYDSSAAYRSEECRELIVQIHQEIVEEYQKHKSVPTLYGIYGYDPDSGVSYYSHPISFTYHLSSGQTLTRRYTSIRETDELNSLITRLSECEEFRPMAFHLDQLKSSAFTQATLSLYNAEDFGLDLPDLNGGSASGEYYDPNYWEITVTSPKDIAELKDALEADVMESEMLLRSFLASSSDISDDKSYYGPAGWVNLTNGGFFPGLSFEIHADFTHTIDFIRSHPSLVSVY